MSPSCLSVFTQVQSHIPDGSIFNVLFKYCIAFNSICIIWVYYLFNFVTFIVGHGVAQLVEALRYKPEGRGFDSRWCHWNFSLTSFRPHYGPGVESASNRNEYQECFLGVKAAGAYG